MVRNEEKEITSRTIPGITWKQVLAFTIGVATIIMIYLRLEALAQKAYDLSKENNELMKQLQMDKAAAAKMEDLRYNQMHLEHREFDLRLKQLEKFVEGYNQANIKYK